MTADCAIINVNLQNRNARMNKAKECKEITFFLNRILRLNSQGKYTQLKQIKKKDRQKHLLILLEQRLSEEDRNQLLKKERSFKCYKFKHLMMKCMMKKQNVSNIMEKNDIKLVIKRKNEKKCRSSSVNNTDNLKN